MIKNDATCFNGNVKLDGQDIETCTVLSEGKAQSSGVVFLEQDKAHYIANTSSDVRDALQGVIDGLTQVTLCFTALDALPTIAGACAAFTAQINIVISQLSMLKENLK